MKALFHFMDWPLRAKMAALLAVASLLPLGVAALIDIHEARERLLENTAVLLAGRGDQLVSDIDTLNRSYQRSVGRFAHLPDVVQFCLARPQDRDQLNLRVRAVMEVW